MFISLQYKHLDTKRDHRYYATVPSFLELIGIALERGIRIPEDLSVVGIDDSYLAGVCKVPFSSVAHPKEALGRKVAENLVHMISDPAFDGSCLMESHAVMRDSIAEYNV